LGSAARGLAHRLTKRFAGRIVARPSANWKVLFYLAGCIATVVVSAISVVTFFATVEDSISAKLVLVSRWNRRMLRRNRERERTWAHHVNPNDIADFAKRHLGDILNKVILKIWV
jgi:hypothetical protein